MSHDHQLQLHHLQAGEGVHRKHFSANTQLIDQEDMNCAFRKQLAEDPLTHIDMLLKKAGATLKVGLENFCHQSIFVDIIVRLIQLKHVHYTSVNTNYVPNTYL